MCLRCLPSDKVHGDAHSLNFAGTKEALNGHCLTYIFSLFSRDHEIIKA